jgi:hypothetical protein
MKSDTNQKVPYCCVLVSVLEHSEPAIYESTKCQVHSLLISIESTLCGGMELGDFMPFKTAIMNDSFIDNITKVLETN